jgi:two-component system, LytTR family, sensor kinase
LRASFFRRYIFHLLFTLVYSGFVLLERQWLSPNGKWSSFLPTLLVHISLMVLIVFGNSLVLIPRLLQKKKLGWYIISITLLILLFIYLRSAYRKYLYMKLFNMPDNGQFGVEIEENIVYALWFTVVSSMLFITQRWTEQQQQVKNIQINQLQTELKYLRAQVNPHFLFNGLNTIYGSIDISNQQARNILLQFSDLLRYNLYEADVDWVDLEKEAQYLQNYVALQRARSDTNLLIELHVQIENKTIRIAPLIFIAFVENAFKYSTRDDNKINSVTIRLEQTGNRILFECSNSYDEPTDITGGIGLNNVKRRLELLYKDRHTLTIKKEGSIYSVQLILQV